MVSLAAGDVDLCLIPEVNIILDGEKGILEHIKNKLKNKGHCVIVVAEGAGESLLGQSTEVDASGNRKLPQIGYFLKLKILEYLKNTEFNDAVCKYIDPSYMIRSVPANAVDAIYTLLLASNGVHAAMAGYTGICMGVINSRTVLLPIEYVTDFSPRSIDPDGRTWQRILSLTGQPNTILPTIGIKVLGIKQKSNNNIKNQEEQEIRVIKSKVSRVPL